MSNHHKNILVVEDNFVAAKVAKMILEKLGCQVKLAEDGDNAVKLFKKNHYDGICMDIGLPIMSGVEACKAIRKYETEQHLTPIPIVAVTGNNSPEEIKEYIKAGMQGVLDKPFTKEKAEHFLSFCK
jgi:CheY-like chemotaxis protein